MRTGFQLVIGAAVGACLALISCGSKPPPPDPVVPVDPMPKEGPFGEEKRAEAIERAVQAAREAKRGPLDLGHPSAAFTSFVLPTVTAEGNPREQPTFGWMIVFPGKVVRDAGAEDSTTQADPDPSVSAPPELNDESRESDQKPPVAALVPAINPDEMARMEHDRERVSLAPSKTPRLPVEESSRLVILPHGFSDASEVDRIVSKHSGDPSAQSDQGTADPVPACIIYIAVDGRTRVLPKP